MFTKLQLKHIAARGVASTNILSRLISQSEKSYVLAYHRVLPPSIAAQQFVQDAMWVSPETFEMHIRFFLSIGEIVSLETLLSCPDTKLPRFAITFDDGWLDNLHHAHPILQKYTVPATIFLVTSAVESGRLFWTEEFIEKLAIASGSNESRLVNLSLINAGIQVPGGTRAITTDRMHALVELLKALPESERNERLYTLYESLGVGADPIMGRLLSWQNIEVMRDYDFQFGSHTVNHKILTNIEPETIQYEVRESKRVLEEKFGEEVDAFCYPNASYDDSSAQIVRDAGYRYAVKIDNTHVNPNCDRMLVPRYSMSHINSADINFLKMRLVGFPGY